MTRHVRGTSEVLSDALDSPADAGIDVVRDGVAEPKVSGLGANLTRLRAVAVNSIIWGTVTSVGWTSLSLVLVLLTRLDPEVTVRLSLGLIPRIALVTGTVGLVAGATFSGLLRRFASGRALDELRPGETSLWGALAGIAGFAPYLVDDLAKGGYGLLEGAALLTVFATVGAVTSRVMIRIAKSAPSTPDRVDSDDCDPLSV